MRMEYSGKNDNILSIPFNFLLLEVGSFPYISKLKIHNYKKLKLKENLKKWIYWRKSTDPSNSSIHKIFSVGLFFSGNSETISETL